MGYGATVVLPCFTPDASIRALEWTRSDMAYPEYILFFSDGRSDTRHQRSCYRDRVDLTDAKLRDGDISLVIRNVSSSDIGTYECRVAEQKSGSRHKRAIIDTVPINIIKLQVTGECVGFTVFSACVVLHFIQSQHEECQRMKRLFHRPHVHFDLQVPRLETWIKKSQRTPWKKRTVMRWE